MTATPEGPRTPDIPAGPDIDLTVRLTEAPGAPEHVFRLAASGGTLAAECTLPDSAAALVAVTQHGEAIFFPKPGPPKMCTQQYGGPQVAVVTGRFMGKEVNSLFSRTDGCEIARWRTMAPLLGGVAGSTGAV
ncbi:serine protease inhibitor [Pseudarthrobacter sp. 1C304]|uniref:serine protease inhibitor n=1 Tax=Pseudarthrobacter sp. 1C304 TaxID=3457438 RepID=UPI003FD0514E